MNKKEKISISTMLFEMIYADLDDNINSLSAVEKIIFEQVRKQKEKNNRNDAYGQEFKGWSEPKTRKIDKELWIILSKYYLNKKDLNADEDMIVDLIKDKVERLKKHEEFTMRITVEK